MISMVYIVSNRGVEDGSLTNTESRRNDYEITVSKADA
jgi:hypothetical protein